MSRRKEAPVTFAPDGTPVLTVTPQSYALAQTTTAFTINEALLNQRGAAVQNAFSFLNNQRLWLRDSESQLEFFKNEETGDFVFAPFLVSSRTQIGSSTAHYADVFAHTKEAISSTQGSLQSPGQDQKQKGSKCDAIFDATVQLSPEEAAGYILIGKEEKRRGIDSGKWCRQYCVLKDRQFVIYAKNGKDKEVEVDVALCSFRRVAAFQMTAEQRASGYVPLQLISPIVGTTNLMLFSEKSARTWEAAFEAAMTARLSSSTSEKSQAKGDAAVEDGAAAAAADGKQACDTELCSEGTGASSGDKAQQFLNALWACSPQNAVCADCGSPSLLLPAFFFTIPVATSLPLSLSLSFSIGLF